MAQVFEPIKDLLYKHAGIFPPHPPSNPPLGELTSELKKKIDQLRTVCLFLGPNRNLTTLAAGVLALHPNCQVMSHGGQRVLPVEELNILENYSDEKFNRFSHFLWVMSQTKDKGSFGGSITITHAFRDYKTLSDKYRKRFGRAMIKKDVQSLIWKEAHRTDDFVAENKTDLGKLIEKNDKLRFILPVRNPLHVAYSFYNREPFRKNFYKEQVENPDLKVILDDLLTRFARTVHLQQEHPNKVMVFFEKEISRDLFVRMAKFLSVAPDERWIADALQSFVVTPPAYQPDAEIMRYYAERVNKLFSRWPNERTKFMQAVDLG